MDISAFPEGAEDLAQHFYPLAITFDHHISSNVPLALSSYAALQFLPSFPKIPLFLFFFHRDVNLVFVT